MKCLKVDHIGIAVKDLKTALKFYEETLGLKIAGTETLRSRKSSCVFACGDSELELLESTSEDGPIARFMKRTARASSTSPAGGQHR
jgi:methylmalonyl-CoA/ethylmalonyl-CoA epimerase